MIDHSGASFPPQRSFVTHSKGYNSNCDRLLILVLEERFRKLPALKTLIVGLCAPRSCDLPSRTLSHSPPPRPFPRLRVYSQPSPTAYSTAARDCSSSVLTHRLDSTPSRTSPSFSARRTKSWPRFSKNLSRTLHYRRQLSHVTALPTTAPQPTTSSSNKPHHTQWYCYLRISKLNCMLIICSPPLSAASRPSRPSSTASSSSASRPIPRPPPASSFPRAPSRSSRRRAFSPSGPGC